MNIMAPGDTPIYRETTFVFGETEVRKTGRTATKPLPGNKVLTVVEVTPVNEADGFWKKFVQTTALLTIQEAPTEPEK
jgi:hypothetical protein